MGIEDILEIPKRILGAVVAIITLIFTIILMQIKGEIQNTLLQAFGVGTPIIIILTILGFIAVFYVIKETVKKL